ncbi:MAG: hypothetical protein KTR20_08045 [Cellvibrionaceae bacterium]|nr:hypothetical protein [Cellvibrionaceae bacterium]
MKLLKDVLAVSGGIFTTLLLSRKLYNFTRDWAEALFVNDYGSMLAPVLLVLWFIFIAVFVFAVSTYLIHLLETMIKIRIIRLFS